jgi:hypothetical protein
MAEFGHARPQQNERNQHDGELDRGNAAHALQMDSTPFHGRLSYCSSMGT